VDNGDRDSRWRPPFRRTQRQRKDARHRRDGERLKRRLTSQPLHQIRRGGWQRQFRVNRLVVGLQVVRDTEQFEYVCDGAIAKTSVIDPYIVTKKFAKDDKSDCRE
jgi:hypothetical protein